MAFFILSHIAQLRPGQSMVEIVLHLVVLWEAQQIAVLHVHQITRACTPNIHFDLEYNIIHLKRTQLYNWDSNNLFPSISCYTVSITNDLCDKIRYCYCYFFTANFKLSQQYHMHISDC